MTNSGQTCVAPDYVLVERSVRDEFLHKLEGALQRFTESKPLPILSARHTERLAGLLAGAGGRTVVGGDVDMEAATAQATVVVDPDPDAAISREEIFGPLLPVVGVDSLDDAVDHIRRGTRPLAAYLFTEDEPEQELFVEEVVAGGVVLNHVMLHLSAPELPFGGVGTSGTGRYHGRWGFETFSNAKAVLRQSTRLDLPLIYPPYRGLRALLLGRV